MKSPMTPAHPWLHMQDETEEKPRPLIYVKQGDDIDRSTWNGSGKMDYLKGTIQEVESFDHSGAVRVKNKVADRGSWKGRSWSLLPSHYILVEGKLS